MTKYTRLDRKTRHAADMYINVLEQLGVTDVANYGLHIETSKEWNDEVFRFIKVKALCLVIRLLVLILAVQCLKNDGPAERFADVADYLAIKGIKLYSLEDPWIWTW